MTNSRDEIVASARAEEGPCRGCPAACVNRDDGEFRSEGVDPGLGNYDAQVMFVRLFDRSPDQYWGGDWVQLQPELRDATWDSYLEIVQTSLSTFSNA